MEKPLASTKTHYPLRLLIFLIALWAPVQAAASEADAAVMYKNPECGCCEGYAEYLGQHGFEVTVHPTNDISFVKRTAGVPEELESCHTLMIGGYVVEGHVPVNILNKLLTERPPIIGISLPGMPLGAPGMDGEKSEPFEIHAFSEGETRIYAIE